MNEIANLVNETVRREIQNGGFKGNYRVEQMTEKPHVSGRIEIPSLDLIVIGYNSEYERINPGGIHIMVRDVTRHEQNHRAYNGFNGCPRNVDFHSEKVIEPIAKVILPKGFGKEDTHYLANALEDSILHVDLNSKFSLGGISEFFSDVGRTADEHRFTPFYDAHVKLNLFLWGNKSQKKQQKSYMTRDKEKQKKVAEVVQNFINRTGISDLEQEIELNGKNIKVKDRKKIRDFLNNENNWENISRVYAEEFSKLMEPSYAMSIPNHSGNGTKGRESEAQSQIEGNQFDKEMQREDYKYKRVQKAFARDSGVPPLMQSHESMDIVYQILARKLNLKVNTFTESEKRAIYWHGKNDFDPEIDKPKHLLFDFNDNGEIALRKRPHYETMSIPHKHAPKGFPEARFCLLDTSGSMQSDPEGGNNVGKKSIIPWGDNSRYHYALLSWYGFIEYLKQNHLLSQTSISLGNFSNKTIVSQGLQQSKKNALSPQWGQTMIDKEKLTEMFKGRGNLCYTISDGSIDNWEDIKTDFMDNARNHSYFHIQIGSDTEMSKELAKKGFPVIPVRRVNDLAQRVIDVTDSIYRGAQ